jgi:hypothetical protein
LDPLGVLDVGVPVEPEPPVPLVPLEPLDPLSALAAPSLFVDEVSELDFVSLGFASPPDLEELE